MQKSLGSGFRLAIALVALLSGSPGVSQGEVVNSVWRGLSGTWSTPSRWLPVGAPNNTPDKSFAAKINGSELVLDMDATVSSLTIGSANLFLGGDRRPTPLPTHALRTGSLILDGGTVLGEGKLIVDGDFIFRRGLVNISSSASDSFQVGGNVLKQGYGVANLAPFHFGDSEVIIEQGVLEFGNDGLGSALGDTIVASAEFARLQSDNSASIEDDLYLNNGRGFSGTGAFVSRTTNVSHMANLYLGDIGAVVGLMSGAGLSETLALRGRIHGGFLELVGRGNVGISGEDHTYTGATRVGVNGDYTTLSLSTTGRLYSTSEIVIGGRASLTFNHDQSGVDRIGDLIPITMHGGRLEASGVTLASLPSPPNPLSVERMGRLRLVEGASLVSVKHQVTAINFNSLQREGSATINFTTATGTGAPSPNSRIGFDEAPALTNSIIGGWATIESHDFATYDPVYGVTSLNNRVARPSQIAGAGPDDHVRVDAGPALTALSQDTTISTLAIQTGGARDVDLGGHTLTLKEGGLIRGGGYNINTHLHGGKLTAGVNADPATLYLHTQWVPVSPRPDGLVISAEIADNAAGGVVSVVKSGNMHMTANGINSYTGSTIVQEGQYVVANEGALPTGGDLVAEGEGFVRLEYEPTSAKRLRRVEVKQGAGISAQVVQSGAESRLTKVALDADEYLFESGTMHVSLAGDGAMRKTTQGVMELNAGSPDYSGSIVIEQGLLFAGGRSAYRAYQSLGTGETEIRRGGTLVHGSAGTNGKMTLEANLNLAGGDVGLSKSTSLSTWEFNGDWRVTAPSRFLTFDPQGHDEIISATVDVVGSVAMHDSGALTILGEGTVNFSTGLFVTGQAEITSDEAKIKFDRIDPRDGGGTLRLSGGGTFILPGSIGGSTAAPLELAIAAGTQASPMGAGSFELAPGTTLAVDGRLQTSLPLHVAGGMLRGTGETGSVLNDGVVAPGNSIGTLHVDDFTQGSDGVLAMELFVERGPISDLLRAKTAVLGGILDASLLPGGPLAPGYRFLLVVADSLDANSLQLQTNGFVGRLDVISLTSGADAGRMGLQLTIVPEPAVLAMIAPLAFLAARRRF